MLKEQQKIDPEKLRNALILCLEESRLKNAKFSVRAFAKKAGLSSGALSEILNGKRVPSQKLSHKICESLAFCVADLSGNSERKSKKNRFTFLDRDNFSVIADSIHYAILCLIETKKFKQDLQWMSAKLRKNKSQVEKAIERLLKLKMLKLEKGILVNTGLSYHSEDNDAHSTANKRSHIQSLEEASWSLHADDLDSRDFTSLTISLDLKDLPKLKAAIRNFREDVDELCKSENATEVYKLAIQLYPLTNKDID